jgi:hypothetical protein
VKSKSTVNRLGAAFVAIAAVFTTCPVPACAAQAQMTGRDILEKCDTGDPSEMVALLAGGVANGLLLGQGLGGPAREFCPPNNGRISNGQYRKVICDFLRQNPRIQSQDSFVAIGISLLRSYPCAAPP